MFRQTFNESAYRLHGIRMQPFGHLGCIYTYQIVCNAQRWLFEHIACELRVSVWG